MTATSASPRSPFDAVARFVALHETALLSAVVLLALALRVVFVLQMRANPYFDDPQLDQWMFVEWGRAVADGVELRPGPFFRAPLYAWFLGLVFKLTDGSLLAPRLVQAVLGAVAVVLVQRLGRRVFGPVVGLLAALMAATYWVTVYYQGELLREGVVDVVNLAGLLGTIALDQKPSRKTSVLAGLAFGLSALLRQQVLLVVPFLALWLFLRRRARASLVLAFCAAVAAPILPVTAYNAVAGGDFVLISSEGGQALWIANNPEADGVRAFTSDTRADAIGQLEDAVAQAGREAGRALSASEVSAHFVRKTLTFLRETPAAAAGLLLRKIRLLLSDWEFGNPEELGFLADRFAPVTRWMPMGFGAALALAALGFVVAARAWRVHFPLSIFLLVYGLSIVLFLVSARHRAPLIPVLLVYSARGGIWIAEAALALRWKSLLAALAGCALVFAGSRSYPVAKEVSTANGLCWIAIAEGRAGHRNEAIRLFEESIALWPGHCEARRGLGIELFAAGRAAEGIAALERAVELCPQATFGLDTLAEMHLKVGRPEAAEPLARRSIGAAPHLHRGHYNLGRACFATGRLPEAAESFRVALANRPDDFASAYMLGIVSAELGREPEAIEALSRAVDTEGRADAEFRFRAFSALVEALARSGRRDEAVLRAEQMIARFPARPEAREIRDRLGL